MSDTPRPARVADVFRGHKLLIGLSAASGLLFAATTLVPPLYVRRLIAAITSASAQAAAGAGIATGGGAGSGADGVSLVAVIAVLVGVFLLRGAARYLYGMTSHQAAYALLADLLQRVYRHLQQLSHRFFAGSRTGTLIARSVSDVESLEDFVAHGVPELVQAVAIPLAMIVVLVAIDPLLTLVVLSPLPVAALVIYLLTRNIRGKWRGVRERYADVVALVEDSLQGMSEIKSFTREAEQARRVGRLADDYRDDIIRATHRSLLPSGIVEMTGGVGVILAVGAGGAAALGGKLQVADLYLFLAYLTFIYQPFLKLADIGEVLFRALASYRRIDELFAVRAGHRQPARTPSRRRRSPASVELAEVTFSYRPGEPVLYRIEPRRGSRARWCPWPDPPVRGQDHRHPAGAALLRPRHRARAGWRPRRAQSWIWPTCAGRSRRSARTCSCSTAVCATTSCSGVRMPATTPGARRRPRRQRRGVHPRPAGRLRHGGGRPRRAPVRRPAPTGGDRPRAAQGRPDPDPGRGYLVGGRRDRGADPGGDGPAACPGAPPW